MEREKRGEMEREERERDGQRSGLTCLLLRVRQEVMDEKKKKKIKNCVCVVCVCVQVHQVKVRKVTSCLKGDAEEDECTWFRFRMHQLEGKFQRHLTGKHRV